MMMDKYIERYSKTLEVLESAMPEPTPDLVLDVFLARDIIQKRLKETEEERSELVVRLVELDTRLKKYSAAISKMEELDEWKKSLQPTKDFWWWHLDSPQDPMDRSDWGFNVLAIVLLTISLSLIVDISTRFLSGGPDTLSAYAVIVQSLLTTLAAGGILTKSGRKVFEQLLKRTKVPPGWWQVSRFGLAVVLLLIILLIRYSLPGIAVYYNNRGLDQHLSDNMKSALNNYNRAIKLNPDYPEAHYNLGLLYEDLGDTDNARVEYRIALAAGVDAAFNNFARLYILDEEYSKAVSFLLIGLDLSQDDDARYDLLKNLGWARLGQKRYSEAESSLRDAIVISADKASAHCLLAQVLERKDDPDGAREEWQFCLQYANGDVPDEDTWIDMARNYLMGDE
jgi:tetratricopeptide (TPR) repeat protein